uniref:EGF-like domain-containing protein n=1 Tax=Rhabditophanes sp. KR3021 TaxID=114890 RepID=A0AC35U0S8_9BILA
MIIFNPHGAECEKFPQHQINRIREAGKDLKHLLDSRQQHNHQKRDFVDYDTIATRFKANSYKEVDIQKCPAGFTGLDCKSPLCETPVPLSHHDGMEGNGERIYFDTSSTCQDSFTIPIDAYLTEVYFYLDSPLGSGYPTGDLFDPFNNEVIPCFDENPTPHEYMAKYCNLVATNGGGLYTFNISSYDDNACGINVHAPTTLVADGGFILTEQQDAVSQQLPADHNGVLQFPTVGVPSYFAFSVSALAYPGSAQQVMIQTNSINQKQFAVTNRYNCNANQIIGPFTCLSNGFHSLFVIGYDDKGNYFQRIYVFNCQYPTDPTPIPTQFPDPPKHCDNGGTLMNVSLPSQYCYCGPKYTGKQCEYKLCFNDAYLGPNQECICTQGFSGDYCEDVKCPSNSGDQLTNKHRALTFIVRATTSFQDYKETIVESAVNIMDLYNLQDPSYFNKFVVVAFGEGSLQWIGEYENESDFVGALNNFVYVNDTTCSDSILEAISVALSTNTITQYPNSPIFVFSDGLSSDSDEVQGIVINQNAFFQGQVFFVLADSTNGQCTTVQSDPSFRRLAHFAQYSQGLISHLTTKFEMIQLIQKLATSIHQTATLLQNDFLDSCAYAPKYQTFFLDDSISFFHFIGAGTNLNFTIFDSLRHPLTPNVTSVSGDTTASTFYVTTKGNYVLELSQLGTGPCQYRIFANSIYQLSFGSSSNLRKDIDSKQTVFGSDAHIVARIDNLNFAKTSGALFAEAVIWTNEGSLGTRTVLYASNAIYRDNCDYEMYFGAWECPEREMLYYLNVFVSDGSGLTVQRTRAGVCFAQSPTPISPTGCQNGGVVDGKNTTNCICPPGYTGTKCSQLVCRNGGIPKNNYCQCLGQYAGTHCQIPHCSINNPFASFEPTGRSLTLLLHKSSTTRSTINSLVSQASQMVQDVIHQHPDFISHYQVISFNDKRYDVAVDTNDPNDFLQGLNNLQNVTQTDTTFSCLDLNLYEPLYQLLQESTISEYGMVYVYLAGLPSDNSTELTLISNYLELSKIELTIVEVSGRPCGQTITNNPQMKTLLDLSVQSGGSFFNVQPQFAGDILKTIPAQYSSQVLYDQFVADCSQKLHSFYFPIDSEGQSLTVILHGHLHSDRVKINPPTEEDVPLFVNIVDDYGYGTKVIEAVKPCDEGWSNIDSHCWLFAEGPLDRKRAAESCHQSKAVLATIFDQTITDYLGKYSGDLTFWIGLAQVNGQWMWDQGDNQAPLSLASTGFTDWSSNQPNDAFNCVSDGIIDGKRGWSSQDCSQKKAFVCVKHSYDNDFSPTDTTKQILPTGIWNVKAQTTTGACHIRILTQSAIRVYNTFGNDIFTDFGSPEPSSDVTNNYMLTHATALHSPLNVGGKLEYVQMFDAQNMSMAKVQTYSIRDNCAYQFVSDPFKCLNNNYRAMISGLDQFGNAFQRIDTITCFPLYSQGQCENGGDFYQNMCVCTKGWTGERCSLIQCVHGSAGPTFASCNCEVGFSGQFCDVPQCTRNDKNNTAAKSTISKTFLLVIDGGFQGDYEDVLNKFLSLLQNVLSSVLSQYPTLFDRYKAVVAFDDGYDPNDSDHVLSTIIDTTDVTNFTLLVEDVIFSSQYYPIHDNEYSRNLLTGLIALLNDSTIAPNSYCYILTAANAIDYDQLPIALDLMATKHTKIDVIMEGTFGLPGDVPYTDPTINSLLRLTKQSEGGFYQVAGLSIPFFWRNLMLSEVNTYSIVESEYESCSYANHYIQLGSNDNQLIIDITGVGFQYISVTDPAGNTNLKGRAIGTHTNVIYIIDIPKTETSQGIWCVSMLNLLGSKEGKCLMRMRVRSDTIPEIAFTTDVAQDRGRHSDFSLQYPTTGLDTNAIVATFASGTLTYAQIYNRQQTQLVWSSVLVGRTNCSFEYISQDLFTCPYSSFVIALNGFDWVGYPFRALKVVHCMGFGPLNLQAQPNLID